jgi:hypothetical protein
VKVCSAYGAGFYYIPGTDICLRVGGAVRADYYHNAPGAFPDATYLRSGTRTQDTHAFRGRGYFILDSRQNTAYGTLRTFANIYQSWTSGAGGLGAGEGTNADRAFIQFAGFTFGRAQSFYDFYGSTGPHANLVNWGGQSTGATGWNVLAYTAQLGNGLSATLAIEDQRRKPIYASFSAAQTSMTLTLTWHALGLCLLPPTFAPDRICRLSRVISVSIRLGVRPRSWARSRNCARFPMKTRRFTGSGVKTHGYAVGGGFTWNNPSAPGSQFGIQASYAKGALGYLTTWSVSNPIGVQNNSTLAYAHNMDAVYDPASNSLHKGSGWGVNAGYQHRFNPNWAWSIHGAYTSIEYGATAEALVGAGTSLDYDVWSLGSRLLWTPVRGLDMGLDIMYTEYDSQHIAGVVKGRTAATNEVWSSMFRVQRNF